MSRPFPLPSVRNVYGKRAAPGGVLPPTPGPTAGSFTSKESETMRHNVQLTTPARIPAASADADLMHADAPRRIARRGRIVRALWKLADQFRAAADRIDDLAADVST